MKLSNKSDYLKLKNNFLKFALIPLSFCILPMSAEAGTFIRSKNAVRGQYIVMMKKDLQNRISTQSLKNKLTTLANDHRAHLGRKWQRSTLGFTAQMSEEDALRLSKNEDIEIVEEDSIVHPDTVKQLKPEWGLDRIDQSSPTLDLIYKYNSDGTGVNAYVIDTGIRSTHNEFKGRMLPGLDLVKDGKNTEDCYGHGTSVAGIIGGTTFGVAKNVNIIPIRMADCYGTGYNSEIITGIDWIIGQRKASGKPSVINISMGGAISSALELAVNNATKAGIVVVVSAGNDNKDACQSSPANIPDAITVGAISKTDNKSNYSNFGSCVDIFAPGDYIWSADFKSDSDKLDLSGTSLASPFVAGAAALYLSSHPSATPAEVTAALKDNATKNVLKNIGSKSPNLLLFTGFRDMLSPSDLIAQKCTIPSNLIVNGDFERGPTVGWSATKNVIATNSKTKPSLSGLWKAAFNGLGKANSAFLKQTVSIPADACSADLSFSAQVITKDGKSNYMKDFLKIYLTDENGKELSNLTVLSNLTTPNNYIKSNVNLLAHKGKTIVINFYGVEDKTLATTFMVDDVSLNVIQ